MSVAFLVDLVSFTVQGVLVTLAAAVLARWLPVERPRYRLGWWQVVLVAIVALPLLGPRRSAPGRLELQSELARSDTAGPAPSVRVPWPAAVTVLLLAGVGLRLARLARGTARLRGYRRRARAFDLTPFEGLDALAGARADVRASSDVAVPATFGLRRPLILLPERILEMPRERQRAIVLHELHHVRRRDWALTVFEELLGAALWFHPAIHYLVGRIRLVREQCVDARVIEVTGGRQAYLESLLEVARGSLQGAPVPAALFLGERHLSERVELLLKEVVMSKVRALTHLSLGVSVLVLAGAVASSSFPLAAPGANGEASTSGEAKGKVSEPKIVHKVAPVYPEDAKKDRIEGVVRIDVRLAKDGSVAEAKPTEGNPKLAEAAVAAVRQWRYEPVIGPDKKPVEAKLTVTINFRLD